MGCKRSRIAAQPNENNFLYRHGYSQPNVGDCYLMFLWSENDLKCFYSKIDASEQAQLMHKY